MTRVVFYTGSASGFLWILWLMGYLEDANMIVSLSHPRISGLWGTAQGVNVSPKQVVRVN
jgi:hypothetical protein